MNEKWLKDIHDRMSNYEQDAPNGLWESIQQKMLEDEKSAPAPHKVIPLIPLWVKQTIGVAAVVAIAFLVGEHFLHAPQTDDERALQSGMTAQQSAPASSQGEQTLPQEECAEMSTLEQVAKTVSHLTASLKKSLQTPVSPLSHDGEETHYVAMAQPAEAPSSEEKNTVSNKQEEKSSSYPPRQYVGNSYQPYMAQTTGRKRNTQQGSHMSVSAFTTGSIGASSTSHDPLMYSAAPPLVSNTAEAGPLLGSLVYKEPSEDISSVKHRQPVRVGLTFAYEVTEKVAVESGLTYTNLSSDMIDGTEDSYFATDQSLHYVGIPLNVKYKAYHNKQLTLYTSAGVLAEKRVSGKIDKTYVVDDQPIQTTHETVKSKPLQMSVNAAVGVQFNIHNNIGIYAEPGVSYYCKDGSDIKTIYQEKPFNFNLNVGVRVSISK